MLLDRYLPRIDFDSYEDFKENFKINVPEDFNFGFDIVDEWAKQEPDKLALVWCNDHDEERRFTFTDIKKLSNQAANYFVSLGIQKGDVVMMILRRRWEYWICAVALHKIGATLIPGTLQLTTKDIVYRGNAAGVKAIICVNDDFVMNQVNAAFPQIDTLQYKIMVAEKREGWAYLEEEIAKFPDTFERPTGEAATRWDDIMLVYFTSGTTGMPKMVRHNFAHPLGHIITAKYWQQVQENKLHMSVSDSGWAKFGWGKIYGQWICGAVIFCYDMDKFIPLKLLEKISKYRITTFCAPPTMFRFFIKEDLSKFDLSSLKYAVVAGEALNPEVYNRFLEATGIKLMEGFGQTETTLSIANFVGDSNKVGSMGRPSPLYDIDIVLPDGTPAKPGETGEIVIRTDKKVPCGLYLGYYNNEEKTKEAWHDGAYHTGDTAWRDEDGYFWYVGRVDDLIKSSGYRIGPFEIESVIMELPYVLECAITAAPDEIRGQVVKASIVLTKGTEASEALKKEIQNYVKEHTAPYKYPRIVEFMEELPKTISGKIRRVALRESSEKQK